MVEIHFLRSDPTLHIPSCCCFMSHESWQTVDGQDVQNAEIQMENPSHFIEYISICWLSKDDNMFASFFVSRFDACDSRTIWKHYVENVSNDQSSCLASTANRHSSDVNHCDWLLESLKDSICYVCTLYILTSHHICVCNAFTAILCHVAANGVNWNFNSHRIDVHSLSHSTDWLGRIRAYWNIQ